MMVLETFDLLVFAGKIIFPIPISALYESIFGEIAYFAMLVLTLGVSHYVERRIAIGLAVATGIIGLVFGGAALMLLSLLILIPWIFVIRWWTGAPDYEAEDIVKQELPKQEEFYMPPPQQYIRPQRPAHPTKRKSVTEKYSFFKNN